MESLTPAQQRIAAAFGLDPHDAAAVAAASLGVGPGAGVLGGRAGRGGGLASRDVVDWLRGADASVGWPGMEADQAQQL